MNPAIVIVSERRGQLLANEVQLVKAAWQAIVTDAASIGFIRKPGVKIPKKSLPMAGLLNIVDTVRNRRVVDLPTAEYGTRFVAKEDDVLSTFDFPFITKESCL